MTRHILHSLPPLCLFISALFFCACNEEKRESINIEENFKQFTERYNTEISEWLTSEISKTEEQLQTEKSPQALKGLNKTLNTLKFRQEQEDFFQFKTLEDLPADLNWQSGLEEPEIGDPKALKGGVFKRYFMGYPSTLRSFGKNANNHFKDYIHNEIDIGLVSLHPITMKTYPGEAQRWAVSADKRTVFYHLHDKVSYNTGDPVKAWHYPFSLYLRLSDNVFDPYYKSAIKDLIANVTVYGDRYLSVTIPTEKPFMPTYCALISPQLPSFYNYFGADYEEYYMWKPEPTTGAYEVKKGNFVKGVSLTQTRVKDWWAKDLKYYRYRYNPDAIQWRTIREETKAFEYFKTGQLDYYDYKNSGPEYWYEKSETEAFHNGYIVKTTLFNDYPRFPRGYYLNTSNEKLKNLQFRKGLHHSMNWKKVIDIIFRGDYQRLNQMFEGYGEFTNANVKARPFNVSDARRHFSKAGYTETNAEGFLENAKGDICSIEVTYASLGFLNDMMNIIRDEAKKAGLKVVLRPLETTVFYRTITNKEFEAVFMSFGISPPFPSYYNYFHSENAYDENGNPKPSTNNMTIFSDPTVDKLCEITRETGDLKELRDVGKDIQQRIHEAAIFIPAYKKPFRRVAYQRWIKWPDTKEITFTVPITDEPHEAHVYWIDEEVKEKTIEAKRDGTPFPESINVIDRYLKN